MTLLQAERKSLIKFNAIYELTDNFCDNGANIISFKSIMKDNIIVKYLRPENLASLRPARK